MRNERGYTLIEILVTIGIMGILAVVLGAVVQQMSAVPEKSNDQVEALHAVQNAVHWLGKDAVSAKSAVGGGSLVLTFPDSTVISYEKVGDVLYRYFNGDNISIARNVTELAFAVDNRTITMDITAAPDSRWNISESQTYLVAMRPSGT